MASLWQIKVGTNNGRAHHVLAFNKQLGLRSVCTDLQRCKVLLGVANGTRLTGGHNGLCVVGTCAIGSHLVELVFLDDVAGNSKLLLAISVGLDGSEGSA